MLGVANLIPFVSQFGSPEQSNRPLTGASKVYTGLYSNDGIQSGLGNMIQLNSNVFSTEGDIDEKVSASSVDSMSQNKSGMTSPYKMLENACNALQLDFKPIEEAISKFDFLGVEVDESYSAVLFNDAESHEGEEFKPIENMDKSEMSSFGEGFQSAAECLKPLVQSVFEILFGCLRGDIFDFFGSNNLLSEIVLSGFLAKQTIERTGMDPSKSLFLQGVPSVILRSGSLLYGGIGTEGAWSSLLYALSYVSSFSHPLRSIISNLSEKPDESTEFLIALVSLHSALLFIKEFRCNFVRAFSERARIYGKSQRAQSEGTKITLFATKFLRSAKGVLEELWMSWSSLIHTDEGMTQTPFNSLNAVKARQWIDELSFVPSTPLATVFDIRKAATLIPPTKIGGREGVARASAKGDLIGRVVAKSRVVNFGDPKKAHTIPLMCEIIIADNTGLLRVSLWNSLVIKHWHRLKVGDIVALRGLRLKYSLRGDTSSVPTFDVEASLNASNPEGHLFILHKDQLPGALEYRSFMDSQTDSSKEEVVFESPAPSCMPLGELSYPFVPISVIHTTPENVPVDVAGLIAYAGRIEREPGAGKNQFLVSRWIVVIDPSSDERFLPMRIFTNSRSDVVLTLKAGDVALFTNIHIKSSVSSAVLLDLVAKRQQSKDNRLIEHSIDSQSLQSQHFNPFAIVLQAWNRRQIAGGQTESNDSLDPRWQRVRYGWDAVLTKLTQTRAAVIRGENNAEEMSQSSSSGLAPSQTQDDIVQAIVSLLVRPCFNDSAFKESETQQVAVKRILDAPMMKSIFESSGRPETEFDVKENVYSSVNTMRSFYGQSSHLTEVVTVDAWHRSVNESLSRLADLNEICSWARDQFPHLKSLQIDSVSRDFAGTSDSDKRDFDSNFILPSDPTVLACSVQCSSSPSAVPVLGSKLILSCAVPSPTRCSVIMSAFAQRISTLGGISPISLEILEQIYPNSAANPLTISECIGRMKALALLQNSIVFTKGAVPLTLTPSDAGLLPWGDPHSGLLFPPLSDIHERDNQRGNLSPTGQQLHEGDSHSSTEASIGISFPETAFSLSYPLGYIGIVDRNGENVIRVNLSPANTAHVSPEVTAINYKGSNTPSASVSLLSEVLQMLSQHENVNEIALTPFSASLLTKDDRDIIRQFGLPRYFVFWASITSSSLMTQETLGRLLKLYATSLCLASTVASLYPRVSACLRNSKKHLPSARLQVLLMFLAYLRCKMLFTSVQDEWYSQQKKKPTPTNDGTESPSSPTSSSSSSAIDNEIKSEDSPIQSAFFGASMWSRAVAGTMLAAAVSAFFHIRASQSLQRSNTLIEESNGSRNSSLWTALVQGREPYASGSPPISSVINIYRSSPGVLIQQESSFKAKLVSLGPEGAKLEEIAGNTGLYTLRGPGERTLYHPPDVISNLSHLVSMPEGVEISLQGMFGSIDAQASEEINEALQWRIDVYKSLLSILREDSAELEQYEVTLSTQT